MVVLVFKLDVCRAEYMALYMLEIRMWNSPKIKLISEL